MSLSSRCLPLGAAIAAAALLAPQAIRAQEFVAWTLCTPGAFSACSSVQLGTAGVFAGANRVGTDVTITMHNLNLQNANDNTYWSGIFFVGFHSSTGSLGVVTALSPLSLNGGATGSADWVGQTTSSGADNYVTAFAEAGPGGLIGGCQPSSFDFQYTAAVLTCGKGETTSLSFTSNDSFDASSFDGVLVYDVGGAGTTPDAVQACTAGNYPSSPAACTVLSEPVSVTPEPVTLSLLATGLIGIAGVRLRRRKRTVG